MKAVHLESGAVEVRETPRPARPAGFALIRLRCAGLCNTDLELQRGYYGFSGIPGHEFAGQVVEADDRALIGRRVVGEINLGCGACGPCNKGLARHCPSRTVLGIVKHSGAFAEFLTLPERNLHVIPDSISDESAVFVEPLAAACEILDQVAFPCNAEIAVLGDGKLGLLIAQVLNAYGLRIHLFGRHGDKLRIAARAGVRTAVDPTGSWEWVIDATGSLEGLRQAIQMVRPRGTIILKSTVHGSVPVDTAPVIVNEVTLIGSRCGRFEPALQLLERRIINVEDMIADRFPLAQAPAAFARAAERGVLKVLLEARS